MTPTTDYGKFGSNIRIARKMANRSNHHQHKLAAVLLKGSKPLSIGWNHDAIHAEHAALNRAWRSKIKGTTLLVIRIRRNGSLGMSKPCHSCMNLLVAAGIRKITYSNEQGELETLRLTRTN